MSSARRVLPTEAVWPLPASAIIPHQSGNDFAGFGEGFGAAEDILFVVGAGVMPEPAPLTNTQVLGWALVGILTVSIFVATLRIRP